MNRRFAQTRRGLSLLEAIAAVVVLSIAVPPTLSLLADATSQRGDSIATTRATLYAQAVMEQVIADASSSDASLGFAVLADQPAYMTSLDARITTITDGYSPFRMTHTVVIGELADESGSVTGNAAQDVYRRIRVEIEFLASTGMQTLVIEHLLTEVNL